MRVWDSGSGRELAAFAGHTGHVLRCRFGPDGRLFSSGVDGTLRAWDLDERSEVGGIRLHSAALRTFVIAPSATLLVSGGHDGLVRVADSTLSHVLATLPLPGKVWSIAAHPREPLVACGGEGGLLHVTELIGLERW